MLIVLAVLFLVLGIGAGVLIAFGNGMSDSPGSRMSLWPAGALLIASIACFVLHHFLRGVALTF